MPDKERTIIRCSEDSGLRNAVNPKTFGQFGLLLGICFWREVREERVWAEYMGEKGGCWRRCSCVINLRSCVGFQFGGEFDSIASVLPRLKKL